MSRVRERQLRVELRGRSGGPRGASKAAPERRLQYEGRRHRSDERAAGSSGVRHQCRAEQADGRGLPDTLGGWRLWRRSALDAKRLFGGDARPSGASTGDHAASGSVTIRDQGALYGELRESGFARNPTSDRLENLRQVAARYQALRRAPMSRSAVRILIQETGHPEVTVRYWICRCRDLGMLSGSGPAPATKRPLREVGLEHPHLLEGSPERRRRGRLAQVEPGQRSAETTQGPEAHQDVDPRRDCGLP